MASTLMSGTLDVYRNVQTMNVALADGTSHASPVTNSAATDFVEVNKVRKVSIHVVNGATNSVVFTVEGSNDGTNWSAIAYGQGASAAYVQTAATVTAGSKTIIYLPDADVTRYVRVNVSSANSVGTAFTLYGRS